MKEDQTESTSRLWCYAALLIIVLFTTYLRVRLRDFPLERDEGEYAYAGQLILQGIPPYQLSYNMKLPGTYAAYAAAMAVFGQTPAGIHLAVLLMNIATILLVYLLTRRLFGRLAGVCAAAAYMVLSNSEKVLGFAGHSEHFVALPAVAGVLVLLIAIERQRSWLYFSSGLLLGVCFLMKQPGLLFAVFAGFYLLLLERDRQLDIKRLLSGLGAYSLGVALPFLLTCLVLYKAGVFEKFWFWTFSYASLYATNVGIGDGSRLLWDAIGWMAGPLLFVLVLAIAGLVALFWDRQAREQALFTGGFVLFSFLAVSVGLYYRLHYFIMLWPAMAMLVGVGMAVATRRLSAQSSLLRAVPWACLFIAFGFAIYDQRDILFEMGPLTACRNVYLENPFPEAIDIADYIREHSSPDARIAVLGSEPEIYFYAHRHSATGYIYTYGLMEPQKYALKMQKEMIAEIEAAQPEFLVFADMKASWLIWPNSNPLIFMWAKDYMQQYYDLVGIADISVNTQFRWGAEAQSYQPRSAYKMMVLKRKGSPAQ